MTTARERNPDPEWVVEARESLKDGYVGVQGRLLSAALEEYDRTHTEEIVAAMEDVFSHRNPWRKALTIARQHAEVVHPDIDDKSYWDHEIGAFDRTWAGLAELAPKPGPSGPKV